MQRELDATKTLVESLREELRASAMVIAYQRKEILQLQAAGTDRLEGQIKFMTRKIEETLEAVGQLAAQSADDSRSVPQTQEDLRISCAQPLPDPAAEPEPKPEPAAEPEPEPDNTSERRAKRRKGRD
jgi:hypothetical protein